MFTTYHFLFAALFWLKMLVVSETQFKATVDLRGAIRAHMIHMTKYFRFGLSVVVLCVDFFCSSLFQNHNGPFW